MSSAPFTFNAAAPEAGKTMLRAYSGEQKGATAFFRNRPLLATLIGLLQTLPGSECRVLFHAASVGAEPYSFAIACQLAGLAARKNILIDACDINADFLAFAQNATYPASVLETLSESEKEFFLPLNRQSVQLSAAIRQKITFLPPASFVEFESERVYDVVCINNALTYVSEAQQAHTIANVARYNRHYFVATAFHPDSIEAHMRAAGYSPVMDNLREIHEGWHERILPQAQPSKDSPEYSWVLPPFPETLDSPYRFCAIFEKTAAK